MLECKKTNIIFHIYDLVAALHFPVWQ